MAIDTKEVCLLNSRNFQINNNTSMNANFSADRHSFTFLVKSFINGSNGIVYEELLLMFFRQADVKNLFQNLLTVKSEMSSFPHSPMYSMRHLMHASLFFTTEASGS